MWALAVKGACSKTTFGCCGDNRTAKKSATDTCGHPTTSVSGSFTRTALGGWESTTQKTLLVKATEEIRKYSTQIASGQIDEDKLYEEGKVQFLIDKEIQTRNGETRTITGLNATITDREQALWMFNANLNWRLDYMGRFILAQKKKVRINHQITIMEKQFSFLKTYVEKVVKNWAEAKLESETATRTQTKVQEGFLKIMKSWSTYQAELRVKVVKMQSEITKMHAMSLKIKKDFSELQIHIRNLKQDQVTVTCNRVYKQYEALKITFENVQKRLRETSATVITITRELEVIEKTIETAEKKWIIGSDNIFSKAQKKLWYLFNAKFGLNHNQATEAQLLTKLRAHSGGVEAYNSIQEFFKLVYSTFEYAGMGKELKTSFCTMGELAKLSKIGKIIINLDNECAN